MSGRTLQLPSFAKINLHLRVLGKRPDGFHELCTVFQTVSLADIVSFSGCDELLFTCDDPAIPIDGNNLIVKAAELLRLRAGINAGARIRLEKRIPSPGGLGGGSSNAAITLIGLSRLWELNVSSADLTLIAAELGSDVPFFLTGGTALGTGRGELIESLDDIAEELLLIVTPGIAVSTPDAYRLLNAPNLTTIEPNRILQICRFEAESIDLRLSALRNDLEESVVSAHPEIGRVKETLLDLGAVNALMSGSGASVFAVFDKKETRQTALEALGLETSWRKFAVAAISREEYREALEIV